MECDLYVSSVVNGDELGDWYEVKDYGWVSSLEILAEDFEFNCRLYDVKVRVLSGRNECRLLNDSCVLSFALLSHKTHEVRTEIAYADVCEVIVSSD